MNQEKYINYLNILKQNSYRLLRLVNNVVDTTKIDSNFFELDLSNYNIVKIVEDITMSTVKFIESKNKKIIFDTNSEEVILLCDSDKIERILLNLISNAVKFSFPNSVIRVNLFLNKKEERVYISVINDGNTITENESKKIFEQFIQSDNLFRRKTEGSGIGLFLAKYFIEMHNGKIWIELENKEAIEFKFYLPINIGTVIKEKNYIINMIHLVKINESINVTLNFQIYMIYKKYKKRARRYFIQLFFIFFYLFFFLFANNPTKAVAPNPRYPITPISPV